MSIENFLLNNRIGLAFEEYPNQSELCINHYGRDITQLMKISYNRKASSFSEFSGTTKDLECRFPGFIDELYVPLIRMINHCRGNYTQPLFKQIAHASHKVQKRYEQKKKFKVIK